MVALKQTRTFVSLCITCSELRTIDVDSDEWHRYTVEKELAQVALVSLTVYERDFIISGVCIECQMMMGI